MFTVPRADVASDEVVAALRIMPSHFRFMDEVPVSSAIRFNC
jgi:hypothetical protein